MSSFNRILVPLDGSELAEQALPFARQLLSGGGSLHLATVHGLAPVWVGVDAAMAMATAGDEHLVSTRAYLESVAVRFRAQGIDVVTGVRQGDVAETLSGWAEELEADLIVMTTHGRGGFSRFWLGSITDRVVRSARTPVLCLKPSVHDAQVPLVLIPLDGSELAEEAIDIGLAAARQLGAGLEFVRVVDPTTQVWTGPLGVPIAVVPDSLVRLKLDARHYLDALRDDIGAGGPALTCAVLTAPDTANAISEHARARGAGMVVMASHRSGWLERAVLGSVTDKVLRSDVRAVLVLRPGVPD
jgi:nucleotide-binding universal stress UspA family protein